MATKKAAKTAKKAPQPVKKAPAKKAAVKPVSKTAKKAEPAKAAPKKVAAGPKKPVKAAPPKAAVKSNTMPKPIAKAKAPVVSKTAAAKPTPAPSSKTATKAKEAPVVPVRSPVNSKHALGKTGAALPKKNSPEPVAAKPASGKPAPVGKPGFGTAKPVPAASAKPAAAAPAKPAPVAVAPPKPAAPPEPKSTVIARPVPKPETKLVELKPIKTSVATTVKYEPDFTKSVLDDPGHTILNAPTMRYSDAELAEFKDLIMRKLEAAKKELTYLQGLITRKDEMGGDESENRYMTMEDGSISMEREQLSQMASRQIQFIDHLEKALMRIENKTYGICRVTGKLIDKARLRAVPHATLSIEAKMGLVKKPENQNIQ
jgi:RNA polymerase-binding transcription factor DksA